VADEQAARRGREAAGADLVRLDLAHVVQQRAGGDEVDVRLADRPRRGDGDVRDLDGVLQQAADLGVVPLGGAGRPLELLAEHVVAEHAVEHRAERRRAHRAPRPVELLPQPRHVLVDVGEELVGAEVLGGQHAQRRGHGELPLGGAVAPVERYVADDLHHAPRVGAGGPLELVGPDGGGVDRPRAVAELEDDERVARARLLLRALAHEELVLHAVAGRQAGDVEGGGCGHRARGQARVGRCGRRGGWDCRESTGRARP
jgi:hypothetical protein